VIPPNVPSQRKHHAYYLWGVSIGLIAVVVLLLFVTDSNRLLLFSRGNEFILILISLALLGTSLYFLLRLKNLQKEGDEFKNRSARAEHRLSSVLRLSQTFVDASDEREVVEQILKFSGEIFGARAASFVPLDERRQPLAAIHYGEIPGSVMNDWVEYLASPSIRQRCEACGKHGVLTQACPLLEGPVAEDLGSERSLEIYCLPLRRGEREFGILNLYFPEGQALDQESQVFLQAMLDETSLALEGVRLRRREIAALSQLQATHQQEDLSDLLSNFLENVRETLKADFAYLYLNECQSSQPEVRLVNGRIPSLAQPMVDALIQGILTCSHPILLGDVAGLPNGLPAGFSTEIPLKTKLIENSEASDIRALLLTPLCSPAGEALGAIVVGSGRQNGFNQRQLDLLQSLASQVTLVVRNSQLMAELQFRSMMAERSRLAREIHDGLAQTLGFLKLQTSQMQNFLHLGDFERLAEAIRISHKILEEAYLDARQAIDGLRIVPSLRGLSPWLEQTVVEFQENSGIRVNLVDVHDFDHLASEVQAQLIRIVQEALSNVRKHAHANQAWVECRMDSGDLILEVRDDGTGFSPEDIPAPSRYGLQGMRERTELIGAEFQVISRPHEGTTVRVRLPLSFEKKPT
jgi:two-component system nitrate/nitrite sensor histidine kinase NarX